MSVKNIPFRKKVALELFRKYRQNEKRIHNLNYILWECTLRCNLNCKHCGSDCKKESGVKDMPQNDFFSALDTLSQTVNPNKTIIVLTGGEPLVRKDIEEIGKKLYDRGFPWGMVTNGMLLNAKRLNGLLESGLRTLTISLDGLEENHNWLRNNKNSYKNTVNALQLIAQTRHVKYDVVTSINRRNFGELEQIKNLLIKLNVKAWRIFTIFPIGRAKTNDYLQLTPEEFKTVFDFIKQVREEGQIELNYGCEGFLGNYEKEVRDNFFFCRAGINIASILADGSISACPNLRGNFIQGNIYQDNFADVWENKYEVFRDRSHTKTGICADCDFYKYCEGNGMHLRDEQSGELLFCHLHRIAEGEENGI